ncbi:MAG: hypothetical protein KA225_01240 [Thauera sp.]|nr:hypothetical protein [Thauera sp.]
MPRLETAASRSIISSSTSSSSGHRPQCGQACTQRHFTAGGPSRRHHDRRSTQGAMRHTKSSRFAVSSIAFYQKRIDRKILFLRISPSIALKTFSIFLFFIEFCFAEVLSHVRMKRLQADPHRYTALTFTTSLCIV